MRKIFASVEYDNHMVYNRGRNKFSLYYDDSDDESKAPKFGVPRFQMSEIHPYDDAKYAWAKRSDDSSNVIVFIKDRKAIDKMTVNDYDPEWYEDYTEYVDEVIDSTAVELLELNKHVKPIIIHN